MKIFVVSSHKVNSLILKVFSLDLEGQVEALKRDLKLTKEELVVTQNEVSP